jgi:hypothetical protein
MSTVALSPVAAGTFASICGVLKLALFPLRAATTHPAR